MMKAQEAKRDIQVNVIYFAYKTSLIVIIIMT